MYCVNDTIMYGPHGVCKISDIVEKDFNGYAANYYVLAPIYDKNSTIYIPVNNDVLVDKMHRVLSENEIYSFIKAIPYEESVWIENENARKEKYRGIITSGDRTELIRMIKALYNHQQKQQAKGRKLRASDDRFLKDAEKMLYDEFALVLHISREQVFPFIMEQIQVKGKNGCEQ